MKVRLVSLGYGPDDQDLIDRSRALVALLRDRAADDIFAAGALDILANAGTINAVILESLIDAIPAAAPITGDLSGRAYGALLWCAAQHARGIEVFSTAAPDQGMDSHGEHEH